jgi:hypothetical protein
MRRGGDVLLVLLQGIMTIMFGSLFYFFEQGTWTVSEGGGGAPLAPAAAPLPSCSGASVAP